ncbi:MAG: DUF4421 family protein [Raineya sp.]|nr:DUF4421 family protein [Raineya sp.]
MPKLKSRLWKKCWDNLPILKRMILYFLPLQAVTQNLSDSLQRDSLYYHSAFDKLIVGLYYNYNECSITFNPNRNPYPYKPTMNFRTNLPANIGISFNYDKIGFSFAFGRSQADSSQVASQFSSFAFSLGGSRFLIEPSYFRYVGFYDYYSKNYDSITFKVNRFSHPTMKSTDYALRAFYFFSPKKYIYRAGFSYTYRQTKKGGSWGLAAQIYDSSIKNETMFWHDKTLQAYQVPLNQIHNRGIGIGGIGAFNIPFHFLGSKDKIWLFSLFASLMLNYKETKFYATDGSVESKNGMSFEMNDLRFSIGLNKERFFFMWNVQLRYINEKAINFAMQTQNFNFTANLGWRFNVQKPKWYEKFTQTKIYKML